MADGHWQFFDPIRASDPDGRPWAPLAELITAKAERDRYRETLRRAQGYILDLADDGNEGAALLSRRIAEDLDGVGEALDA
jgi:hypothetical protein